MTPPLPQKNNRDEVIITRRSHPIYLDYCNIKKRNRRFPYPCPVGQFQYFVESSKGMISVEEWVAGKTIRFEAPAWMIKCEAGDLFPGDKVFPTLSVALKVAVGLLNPPQTSHSS